MDIIKTTKDVYKTVYVLGTLRFAGKRNPFLHRLLKRKIRGDAKFLVPPRVLLPIAAYIVTSGDWGIFQRFFQEIDRGVEPLDFLRFYQFFDLRILFDPIAFLVFLPIIVLAILISKALDLLFARSSRRVVEISILYSVSIIYINIIILIIIIPASLVVILFSAKLLVDISWLKYVYIFILFLLIVRLPFVMIFYIPQIPFNAVIEEEWPEVFPQVNASDLPLWIRIRSGIFGIFAILIVSGFIVMGFVLTNWMGFYIDTS